MECSNGVGIKNITTLKIAPVRAPQHLVGRKCLEESREIAPATILREMAELHSAVRDIETETATISNRRVA